MKKQHAESLVKSYANNIRYLFGCSAIIGSLAIASPSTAAGADAQEFKETLLTLAAYLDARTAFLHAGPSSSANSLEQQVMDLTDEQLEQFSDSIPDAAAFITDVTAMTSDAGSQEGLANARGSELTTSLLAEADLTCAQDAVKDMPLEEPLFPTPCFKTDYPVGDQYDLFTATAKETLEIPSFNPFDPTIEIPARIADPTDRCNSNEEARGILILSPLLVTAGILAEVPVVGAVAETFVIAAEIAISQCELQDALIDGAEIEAAYANSERIISQLNGLQTEVNTNNTAIRARVDALENQINAKFDTILANQAEILRLIKLPLGQRKK